ncbi:MAG: hypothetical protein ACRDA4_08165 [Filifactoraceae bacterium]
MNNTITISKDRFEQLQKCEDELRVLKLLCKSIAEIANKDSERMAIAMFGSKSRKYDVESGRVVRCE